MAMNGSGNGSGSDGDSGSGSELYPAKGWCLVYERRTSEY
jgi:hypothetical protein